MEFSEHIKTPKIEEVIFEEQGKYSITGTACLTGHHLILYSHNGENKEVWCSHKNVDAVEKKFNPEKNVLVIKCKDFKQYQLTIPKLEDAMNVCSSIEALSHVANPSFHYPFFYKCSFKVQHNGYDLFSVEQQFILLSKQSTDWRLTDVNKNFEMCKSYPRQLIVPKSIDDMTIKKSAKFRQDSRFPVLSYYHTNGRVLLRSSQPMIGQGNKRCKEDEKLVNAFLGSSHRGYVLDTRSVQTANQARAKGGGFETEVHYPQWRRISQNMSKSSIQQESLIRLVEACQDTSSNSERWQSKLESSGWLGIVRDALAAACLVAQCIDREGTSVLVHGSFGTDTTLQVTSLSQVVLDPFCRTLQGFLSLIDKEWILAGHPFGDRCFHSALSSQKMFSEGSSFTVFLDCVQQLHKQFPLAFEFSEALLTTLNKHAYSSEFGTFLCNNEMERQKLNVESKTVSLWSYILSESKLTEFLNPIYQKRDGPIWPSVAPQSLSLWDGLFLPDIDSAVPKEKVIRDSLSEIEQLQEELSKLSKEVSELQELVNIKDGMANNTAAILNNSLSFK